ncbi:MAG: hypothetical protein K6T81_07150 [Alicyclobacillus macrosporangiidus]|uniref:hypothetical protein n=1 Tax=Alicyclobacillus macrosporangiidus TaxID=392015 RepID=UPI0026F3314E|nr:hypothetical protein [Alicyclobacillus macrosporangiidus]MCL6598505.1 hypothetical protein [Alicyclobacillus macrosporangiidus]
MLGREYIRLVNQGGGYLSYAWPFPNAQQFGEEILYIRSHLGLKRRRRIVAGGFPPPDPYVQRWLAVVIPYGVMARIAVNKW